jgi:hypothetical protein
MMVIMVTTAMMMMMMMMKIIIIIIIIITYKCTQLQALTGTISRFARGEIASLLADSFTPPTPQPTALTTNVLGFVTEQ